VKVGNQLFCSGESKLRQLTHNDLVDIARRYLCRKHPIVLTELGTGNENADAIGWSDGYSVLIECKASLSDYYSDGSKHFRQRPETGMGDYRFYLTPKGLLGDRKVRDGWGLLETDGRCVSKVKAGILFPVVNKHHEIVVMTSAMRRLGQTTPSGVSVKAYYQHTGDRATCTLFLDD